MGYYGPEKRLREIVLDHDGFRIMSDALDLGNIRYKKFMHGTGPIAAWEALCMCTKHHLLMYPYFVGECQGVRHREYTYLSKSDHRWTALRRLVKEIPDVKHYLYKMRCGKWLLIAPRSDFGRLS